MECGGDGLGKGIHCRGEREGGRGTDVVLGVMDEYIPLLTCRSPSWRGQGCGFSSTFSCGQPSPSLSRKSRITSHLSRASSCAGECAMTADTHIHTRTLILIDVCVSLLLTPLSSYKANIAIDLDAFAEYLKGKDIEVRNWNICLLIQTFSLSLTIKHTQEEELHEENLQGGMACKKVAWEEEGGEGSAWHQICPKVREFMKILEYF